MDKRVNGRIALITGAASGIGAASAELLAAEGAVVILADVNRALGVQVAERIGGTARFMHLDVSQEEAWIDIIEHIDAAYGGLDILVNSAGVVLAENIETTSSRDFDYVMNINARGIFLGCKYALSLLKRSDHGSIINICSTTSHQGFGSIAYGASKGAVRTMTKSIAVYCQTKGYKVRCNSVHPHEIETPMIEEVQKRLNQPQEVPSGILPFGKLGAPIDVAYAVLYLASTEARFLTGCELAVDNGLLARPAMTSGVLSAVTPVAELGS